ncbi:hypothetical protein GCM10023075_38150 [Streptosporangium album]
MKSSPPPPSFEGLRAPGSGPTDPHPRTRKRMPFWDRVKFVVILTIIYFILVWNAMASYEGIMSFREALVVTAVAAPWIFWLLGAEVLRQVHFFVSERSAGYHRFWTRGVFGGFERWTHRRFSDWNRFRIARAVKWLFWIAVLALRTARRDRGARRLRAQRPAAVGAARHRQDPDGRGGGGGDGQAVRLRGPRCVRQHVHGHRHPEGEVAVP